MSNIEVINFLLEETSEEIDLTQLHYILISLYKRANVEDYSRFADVLNEISNNYPISIKYTTDVLNNCHFSIPPTINLNEVIAISSVFTSIDSGKTVGRFIRYLFSKYNTVEEIKNGNIDDIGAYYKSKFLVLQETIKDKSSVFNKIINNQ